MSCTEKMARNPLRACSGFLGLILVVLSLRSLPAALSRSNSRTRFASGFGPFLVAEDRRGPLDVVTHATNERIVVSTSFRAAHAGGSRAEPRGGRGSEPGARLRFREAGRERAILLVRRRARRGRAARRAPRRARAEEGRSRRARDPGRRRVRPLVPRGDLRRGGGTRHEQVGGEPGPPSGPGHGCFSRPGNSF